MCGGTRTNPGGKGTRKACLDKVANVQDRDAAYQMQGASRVVPECAKVRAVNMTSISMLLGRHARRKILVGINQFVGGLVRKQVWHWQLALDRHQPRVVVGSFILQRAIDPSLVEYKLGNPSTSESRKTSKQKGKDKKLDKKGMEYKSGWKNGKDNGSKFKSKADDSQSKNDQKNKGCFICDGPRRAKDSPKHETLNAIVVDGSREGSDSDITRVNPLQLFEYNSCRGDSTDEDVGFFCGTCTSPHGKGVRKACLDKMANVQDNDVAEHMQGASGVVPECVTVYADNSQRQLSAVSFCREQQIRDCRLDIAVTSSYACLEAVSTRGKIGRRQFLCLSAGRIL
ncbi:hypothetical protein Acr_05g0010390 [Actinidia rufa]|uniref:Uncharacterized protein n=1 Tax=Actinidia rufa TaxID=165716 RepID=A0A7J0ELX7_9ERIC|nr:hypothetical protein Acr_05g0010390 [Actinidia rufa]